MVFLPILIVAYRDGSILTVFRQGLFFLGPILLWLALARLYSIPSAQAMRMAALRRWRQSRRAAADAASGVAQDKPAEGDESALPRAERLARKRLRQMAARRQPKLLR